MFYNVKIQTKASLNKVEKIDEKTFKVYTTAIPDKGEANSKVIKLLSDFLKIGKSKIIIIKGKTSKNKLIKINE